MTTIRVEDLTVGALDQVGLQIREIYARKAGSYCVYRTEQRVAVQYADKDEESARQRVVLAPLGMLRSEINGLIDGWRRSSKHRARAKTKLYDRRCADALISAFENDAVGAAYQLQAVRNTIIGGRIAIGRFQYLGTAFAMALACYLVLWLVSLPAISSSLVTTNLIGSVLIAIAGGALGAFLSIAIALKGRTVLPDLQWISNACDAVLRMTVGIVAAALFICMLKGGFRISFAGVTDGTSAQTWMQTFTLGFVAGFFERLVPDLLDKAAASVRPSAADDRAVGTGLPAGPQPTPGDSPAAPTRSEPPRDPDASDCLCDEPLPLADAVPDSALPAATGGVQGDVA